MIEKPDNDILYINNKISEPINRETYNKIITDVEEYINKFNNMNSNSVKICKAALKFLKDYRIDCMKDVSMGDNYISVSYDGSRGNKRIGAYALVVSFSYDLSDDGTMIFDTIFEMTYHNAKKQMLAELNEKSAYSQFVKEMKDICLMNTFNNEIALYSDEDFINSEVYQIAKYLSDKLKNPYIQVSKTSEMIRFKLTPERVNNGEFSGSFIEIYHKDNKISLIKFKNGVNESASKDIDLSSSEEDIESIKSMIDFLVSHAKLSKGLLYQYSISSFSDKIFAHKS